MLHQFCIIVEPHIPFAASNAHPRLNVLLRRDCHHTHHLAPDCTTVSSGVIEILSLQDCLRKTDVSIFSTELLPLTGLLKENY